jgi:hypothetical protein
MYCKKHFYPEHCAEITGIAENISTVFGIKVLTAISEETANVTLKL